jgi:branched-chain amino acid transport system ATP-binding protein
MLNIERLTSGYGRIDAIRSLSLRVPTQTIVAVLGANGAGKTALMRAISGLNPVRSGQIRVDGTALQGRDPAQIMRLGVVQVPQGRALFGAMSVLENLEMGAYVVADRDQRASALDDVFWMFPILKERASQAAAYLSGGEQQMLAIGRALMARPRLLLLDEPSLGLAPKVFDGILEAIREIHARGATVLVAEQNARKLLRIASHGYVLENGAVALEGAASELARDPRIAQAYLGTTH